MKNKGEISQREWIARCLFDISGSSGNSCIYSLWGNGVFASHVSLARCFLFTILSCIRLHNALMLRYAGNLYPYVGGDPSSHWQFRERRGNVYHKHRHRLHWRERKSRVTIPKILIVITYRRKKRALLLSCEIFYRAKSQRSISLKDVSNCRRFVVINSLSLGRIYEIGSSFSRFPNPPLER